jgi:transposase
VWTDKNRAKYNRDHLRYPSDLTDDEWAYVEPLIPPARRGGGKRRTDMRAVMNGVMYILSTGCQWRYIPKDFPPRSTLHDYSRGGIATARWTRFITPCTSSAATKPSESPPLASSTARA